VEWRSRSQPGDGSGTLLAPAPAGLVCAIPASTAMVCAVVPVRADKEASASSGDSAAGAAGSGQDESCPANTE